MSQPSRTRTVSPEKLSGSRRSVSTGRSTAKKPDTEYQEYEVEIHGVRLGSKVRMVDSGTEAVLVELTPGAALVDYRKKTKSFGHDVEVDVTTRISRNTRVVVVELAPKGWKREITEVKLTGQKSKEPVRNVETGRSVDDEAKRRVEALLLEGGRKYDQIRNLVAGEFEGWSKSVSYVSNCAFYMRKEGRLRPDHMKSGKKKGNKA